MILRVPPPTPPLGRHVIAPCPRPVVRVCEMLLPLEQALLLQAAIVDQTGRPCPCATGSLCPLLAADPHPANVEPLPITPAPVERVEKHARIA